ncbi:MAG: HNH endonuclease family protein [Candidatus Saccharimonadales bacterium]
MYRRRRSLVLTFIATLLIYVIISLTWVGEPANQPVAKVNNGSSPAAIALKELLVKGRAPKTGYTRDQFGSSWLTTAGCDTRNIILNRDLYNVVVGDKCQVVSGMLNDPYTGKIISFIRGGSTSGDVQIDHVVALSDAWQKGAQQLTREERVALANDPLELLAVDGGANQQKLDGDTATWLPSNKAFRCQYVARQIAIKQKYKLWVTAAEHDAMNGILEKCPDQLLPSP